MYTEKNPGRKYSSNGSSVWIVELCSLKIVLSCFPLTLSHSPEWRSIYSWNYFSSGLRQGEGILVWGFRMKKSKPGTTSSRNGHSQMLLALREISIVMGHVHGPARHSSPSPSMRPRAHSLISWHVHSVSVLETATWGQALCCIERSHEKIFGGRYTTQFCN